MKTSVIYGLGMGASGAVLAIVMYLLGLHSDPAKLPIAQAVGLVGGLGIAVTFVTFGIKARRAQVPPGEEFGYGKAVGAGVMIALFSSLLGIATTYTYATVINPEFADVIVQAQLNQMEGQHAPAKQIEITEKVTRFMMKPVVQVAMSFVGGMVMGTAISLIAAAFLKRPALPPDLAPPVVT